VLIKKKNKKLKDRLVEICQSGHTSLRLNTGPKRSSISQHGNRKKIFSQRKMVRRPKIEQKSIVQD